MDLPGPGHLPIVAIVRGYGQFCPVAKASEIVAERWTPLVLRELLCGSQRFNDLHRGVPLMSRTLLTRRLRELEDAGVIERRESSPGGSEYRLTPAGEELRPIIEQLGAWGHRWVRRDVEGDDLDPSLLMWDVRRRIDRAALPDRRVVVRFDLRGVPREHSAQRTWWLVLDRDEVDLCLKDPGFPVDITVDADLGALTRVWMGRLAFAEAVRSGLVHTEGQRPLVRAFPGWLGLSTFASVPMPSVP
jgi:DNA-binding HxlR family transcriptional regulator